jgi:hypothetical protein
VERISAASRMVEEGWEVEREKRREKVNNVVTVVMEAIVDVRMKFVSVVVSYIEAMVSFWFWREKIDTWKNFIGGE